MGRKITVELTEKQAQALIAAANHHHQHGNLTPSQHANLRNAQGEVHDALPLRIDELECEHAFVNGVCARCTELQPLEGDSDGQR